MTVQPKPVSILAAAAVLGLCVMSQTARANDTMFPPSPSAQSSINIDGKGFIIHGKRTFIVSAGIEYARIPRELWRDRLLRLQRAGFNCVEVYTFWNYHEPQPGKFDFSGNHDLDAFLKLAQSLGLYATVRVGPYYCAEWDSGGYPIWLRFQPGLKVRVDNDVFEQDVTRFWGHLLPIVVKDQISHGGNVIMVQLENEHPQGWGTDGLSNPYFKFLQKTAVDAGIDVPYFFSGLHHGSEPGGSGPGSNAGRTNPWFSTEFWCDWYNDYGETSKDALSKDRATWKILAYGGNGYNYYMADGGSNFDYFNDDEDASSYDYGAAIGEGGDLRPEYYKFKRAALFARAFQDILENDNGANARQDVVDNKSIAVSERTGPAGTIFFLDNSGKSSQQARVNLNGMAYPRSAPLTLNAGEFVPIVTNYAITDGVTLDVAPTRILGSTQQGDTTTLVIYGQPGTPAELYFSVSAQTTIKAGSPDLKLDDPSHVSLKTVFSDGDPHSYSFIVGQKRVRILAVSDSLADNTWFVNTDAQQYVVTGPAYIGNAVDLDGRLRLAAETPWGDSAPTRVLAYGPSDVPMKLSVISPKQPHPDALTLSSWQTMDGSSPSAINYYTTGWLASTSGPQQMGVDGDVSCYAWYRTKFDAPGEGPYTISLGSFGDHMLPFIDGTPVSVDDIKTGTFKTDLTAGSHTLAVFTSHYGRNKFFNFLGAINQSYMKGLTGPVNLQQAVGDPVSVVNWKTMPATEASVGTAPPSSAAAGWTDYTIGADAFNQQQGYAWFQTTLPPASQDAKAITAAFNSVDDNGWVYLNGVQLTHHEGWNQPFQIDMSSAWKPNGPNVLSVLVQNTGGAGGIDLPVTLDQLKANTPITNWVQKGGPGNPDSLTGWHPFDKPATIAPRFFKTTFMVPTDHSYPIWRVITTGLSHGSVWVNGHNLGRYPENIPAPGVYIPECWLVPGKNTMVIFDESGAVPSHVQIQPEVGASRDIAKYESGK